MSSKTVNAVRERESRRRRAEIVAVAQPKKAKQAVAKAKTAAEAKPKKAETARPEIAALLADPESVTETRTWPDGEVTSFYPEPSDEPVVETGDTEA